MTRPATRRRRDIALFLGGYDLEMITIADIGRRWLGPELVYDKRLRWGANAIANAYASEIGAALASGLTAALVELKDDLPSSFDRAHILIIDHHEERAGADQPSALRQVFAAKNLVFVEVNESLEVGEFDKQAGELFEHRVILRCKIMQLFQVLRGCRVVDQLIAT